MPDAAPGAFLAIDWGTSNRRTYLIGDDGTVLARERDDRGVLAIAPGGHAEEVAQLRRRFGPLPIVAAGMIGSTRGWHEARYVDAPAGLEALAAALLHVAGQDLAIVPGVAIRDGARADVMRGEEVQLLGAVVAGLAPADALLCQPGTHNKWATMRDGRIADFTTAMTGELFALLRQHSILREMIGGMATPGAAFRAGVARAGEHADLTALLFGVRPAVLLGMLPADDATSFCSGLLIGADVAARDIARAGPVHILADGPLGDLYAAAIETLGGRSVAVDGEAAFVAGIGRIRELAA